MPQLEDLIERVERLLLRHDELKRTNGLLCEQLEAVAHERDSLRSRLSAARGRIDALLERLPNESPQGRAAPSPPPVGVQESWGGPAFPGEVSVGTAAAARGDAQAGERAA